MCRIVVGMQIRRVRYRTVCVFFKDLGMINTYIFDYVLIQLYISIFIY